MKISRNWLKQYTDIKLSDDELVERIASRIAEVESVVEMGPRYIGVVVADIVEAKDHPDADKLGVYQIDNGASKLQVVAGDKSLKVGDKVAHIPVGNTVPSTFGDESPLVLEKRDLRGEDSNGMLASAAELDFGDNHEGVLVLDTDSSAGTNLSEVYELDDLIIEVENKALTHRPDCFGIIGFAREVAGVQNIKFSSPDWFTNIEPYEESSDELEVSVENQIPELVPRITLRAFSNVEIKDSPIIMQSYLARVGLRPINNIVDITNYLMVASGQPLHAFDYDKVADKSSSKGASLVVRKASEKEKLTLLDGKEIELSDASIVIATDKEALALAGVMGGADSEVSAESKNILMEVANFDLYSIRESSMKYGIFTDAVTRFSRGQDPYQCSSVQNEAANLLEKFASATIASKLIDDFPAPEKPKEVSASFEFINNLLGSNYSPEIISANFENVEFSVNSSKTELKVIAPTWRRDIHIKEDLAEEVGRLNGYDNIDVTVPTRTIQKAEQRSILQSSKVVRDIMSSFGANEVLSYNFVSSDLLSQCSQDVEQAYNLRNAISPKLHYLRTTITPGVLEKVYPNIRKKFSPILLFEIGKSHSKNELVEDNLPKERVGLSVVFSADDKTVDAEYGGSAYYGSKQIVSDLAEALNISDLNYIPVKDAKLSDVYLKNIADLFDENRAAVISVEEVEMGIVGEYKSSVKRNLKLPKYTSGFELDVEVLDKFRSENAIYQVLSKFPEVEMDVTLSTPDEVSYQDLRDEFINSIKGGNVRILLEPVSIYRAENSNDKRNISFRVRIIPSDSTKTTKEINELIGSAVEKLSQKLKVQQV